MAEYIDRKQIKCRKERVLNRWAGTKHTDCDVTYKTIVEKYDIDNIPTADVIERSKYDELNKLCSKAIHNHTECLKELHEYRSKINEAIEEMERIISDTSYVYTSEGVKLALKILKRNIGE